MKRLEIENFYSIRERQVVDLAVSAKVPDNEGRFTTIGSYRVPRIAAFYGPNASGKSNVLRAVTFVAWFVQHSFQLAPDVQLPFEPFAADEMIKKPTRIMVDFWGDTPFRASSLSDGNGVALFRYQLELASDKDETRRVKSEKLSAAELPSGSMRNVFSRTEAGEVSWSPALKGEGNKRYAELKVRHNCSAISFFSQFNHEPALAIRANASTLFTNILTERVALPEKDLISFYTRSPDTLAALNRDIQRVDLGLERVEVINTASGPQLQFIHYGLNRPLFMPEQSNGTQHFLRIFPLIFATLQQGGIAVIDELDITLHPTLAPEIFQWFHDPCRNPKGARLWFTSQSPSMMDHLVKEEIFFCQKRHGGDTDIYGLKDIAAVRRDDNFMRKYLGGIYGALPMVG